MEKDQLHILFQREFTKMVAVISKVFGLKHIEIAEDIVSETFLQAAETWDLRGVPSNPTAWLYAVARQKMLLQIRRGKIFDQKVAPHVIGDAETIALHDREFDLENIRDSQLQMIFAVCNPAIASESQIGLALRILCGFGIDEIADAFLSNKETINKRLLRARDRLREEQVTMELPADDQLEKRLDNVLHIVYLLFNEGYYSKTDNKVLRKDLCLEALRLGLLLTEFALTDKPKTRALVALMCFHASRFDARQQSDGSMILYDDQDESLWDATLISKGNDFLNRSAEGDELSSYHLEAGIAFWHTQRYEGEDKWRHILDHYNMLVSMQPSPLVSLNRIFALAKVSGKEVALSEAQALNLKGNQSYHLLLGDLFTDKDNDQAWYHFSLAHQLSKTDSERAVIEKKMNAL